MILELENICKEYMQGKIPVPVLKNINFSMEEGEYVAIMGPSGSGKTTLMNIVGCLDQATSGRLILDGQDISKCSDNQMSDIRLQKIGFVFQNFQLLARQSAMENVCLPLTYAGVPKKERRERAAIALERVGLGDRMSFNRPSSPADRNSVWRLQERLSTIRKFCWLMSRPERSTPIPASRSWSCSRA